MNWTRILYEQELYMIYKNRLLKPLWNGKNVSPLPRRL